MAQDAFRNMVIKRVIVHQVFRRDTDNKVRNPFFSSECVTLSDGFNTKMKERIIKIIHQIILKCCRVKLRCYNKRLLN